MSKIQWVASLAAIAVMAGVGSVLYFDNNKHAETDQPDLRAADDLWSGKGQPVAPLPPNFKPADITGADLMGASPSGANSAEVAEDVASEEPVNAPTFRKADATWENIDQELREVRRVDPAHHGRMHDQSELYRSIALPGYTDSADYPTHCAALGEWRDALPDSPYPLIALASAHVNWAWEARGGGVASTVTEEGWAKFSTRLDEAVRLVERAIQMGVADGEAYRIRTVIGMGQGASAQEMRDWFDSGRKIDPHYLPLYRQHAIGLLPRWGGEPGEVERFVNEVPTLLPGDDGLEFMGLVAHEVHTYECNDPTTLLWGDYDRELLTKAVRVVVDRYPDAPGYVHFAALVSMVCQDHELAKHIRPLVGDFNAKLKVFAWKNSHEQFLRWAEATHYPEGEAFRLYVNVAGCNGIAFAEDPRYLWVGQPFGVRSAALLDSHTRKVVRELPHPQITASEFAVDPGQQLAVVGIVHGPRIGWLLYDLASPGKTLFFDTQAPVEAVAINPNRRQVAWFEETKLRLFNLDSSESEGANSGGDNAAAADAPSRQTIDVDFGVRLPPLFSRDGRRFAIGHRIVDAATGEMLVKLPQRSDAPAHRWFVRRVLDIDEGGQVYAVAGHFDDDRSSVARYSPDGKQVDILLENVGDLHGRCVLSPDRRWLAFIRANAVNAGREPIRIFDVQSQCEMQPLAGHWNKVGNLVFSADSRKLATITAMTDVVKIWSLDDLQPKGEAE
jgi:hypothetical protein